MHEDYLKCFNENFNLRFIGPFLETVNRWERNLALISEIIDEWLVVQRKWLYLEGIFIGGDIRSQLPDEAKKFDDIDKAYRRVSCYCKEKCFHYNAPPFPSFAIIVKKQRWTLSEWVWRGWEGVFEELDLKQCRCTNVFFLFFSSLINNFNLDQSPLLRFATFIVVVVSYLSMSVFLWRRHWQWLASLLSVSFIK